MRAHLSGFSGLPPLAVLELTYRCNHACLFCSCPWEADAAYRGEELSAADWERAVDNLMAGGTRAFTLTGGEPLMREDLKEIAEMIQSKGAPVNLISNGRKIDDAFLDYLGEKNIHLNLSLPGLQTFSAHTGVDNVGHVLSLFKKAQERGNPAAANITVTKKNLPELYENIAYPLLLGADYVLLNRFMPGGRGLKNDEYLLDTAELNQMLEIAERVLSKAHRHGHVGTELPLCAVAHPERYEYLRISTRCAAAKDFFVVDPSGYLKVCNHSPVRICRFDESDKLARDPYWRAFRERDYYADMCDGCKKRGDCDGGCPEAAHVYLGDTHCCDPLFAPCGR